MQSFELTFFFQVTVSVFMTINGHGRLLNPLGRSSAWRGGFDTPKNFNDNELYCGGFAHQQSLGGKCGVCGDPYDQPHPRENEAGGKYAKGVIVKYYTKGSTINITVEITSNHLGFFEFRLCENNDVAKPITKECLKYLLPNSNTGETKHQIGKKPGNITIALDLPSNVTCSQCVIQWRYHTGNSWGTDENGNGLGFGPQEEFYACSDIAISNRAVVNTAPTTSATSRTTTPVKTTPSTPTPVKTTPSTAAPVKTTDSKATITDSTPTTARETKIYTTLSSILKTSTSGKPAAILTTTERIPTSGNQVQTTTEANTATRITTPTTTTPSTTPAPSSGSRTCVSVSIVATDSWCDSTCNHVPPHCPSTVCRCS
ncbi:mucin-2-like [Pecten maximus]|uniref:mucin-2-like n=1 Tax=Pecten maximus TaxID=6579 RepID=UPI001458E1D3|nr:mucin-2-like [Pecten maximus]